MPESKPGHAARWGARAAVFGSYLAVVVGMTWPVAPRLSSAVVGHELSGCWRTIWAHWWTGHRLSQDGAWPLTAPEIAFPREGPFSSIAPVNDLLSLPLQSLFGLVAAYNLVVFFHMLLALTGGYALGRSAGLRRLPAWLTGLVFGLNGFLLSYGVSSAVVETSTVGWVAWFLAAMLWLVREPGWRPALATGATFAIAGLASFYWTVIIAVCLPPLAIGAIWARRDRGDSPLDRRLWLWVGASIVVAAVVFGPPAAALMETYIDGGAVLADYAERKQLLLPANVMAKLAHDFATVSGYLVPGKDNLTWHEDMDSLAQTTYAGWIALTFAVSGIARGRWRWVALALWGALLSLGPFLFITGSSYRSEAVWYWVLLRDVFPPVRLITSYVRFSAFFFLGLAVLAGFGLQDLIDRAAAERRALVAPLATAAACAAVIAELFLVSPVITPLPYADAYVPEVSAELATLEGEGAVLDWPQRYPGKKVEVSRYFYYQSRHARPIPYDFAPTSYMPSPIEGNSFFKRLELVTYGDSYTSDAWSESSDFPARRGIQELVEMGFAYVVVHPEFIEDEREQAVLGWLSSQLPAVETDTPGGLVFRLELLEEYDAPDWLR